MEYEKLWNISRIFPEIFPYMCGLFILGYPSIILIILILLCYISLISNVIFKLAFSYLYKLLGVSTLPVLGMGVRPKDSLFCGTFTPSCSKYNDIQELKRQLNFGMPSGHATCVFIVGVFLLLQIWKEETKYDDDNTNDREKNENDNDNDDDDDDKYKKKPRLYHKNNPFGIQNKKYIIMIKIIQSILIISFIILICYSRVYIEKCHTIEQVFVGGLIGIGTIYLYSLYENYIIDCIQNNTDVYIKLYFITLIIIFFSMFVN